MRKEETREAVDLLFRLPRIVRTFLHGEMFRPPRKFSGGMLAPHHMLILKVVDEEGGLHISEIGELAGISKAQMTRSIDKLTALGMLKRVPDPDDRRKITIILTEEGAKAVMEVDLALKERMKERLSRLKDEELTRVLDSLKYLAAKFEQSK